MVFPSADSGRPVQSHHHLLGRAVDVGVQQADLSAFGGERQRQVYRSGGFAHPAFAGRHGDHVLHAGHQLDAGPHGVGDDLYLDVGADIAHAGDGLEFGHDIAPDDIDHAFGGVAEQDFEGHVVALDLDVAGFLAGDVVLPGHRVGEFLQG